MTVVQRGMMSKSYKDFILFSVLVILITVTLFLNFVNQDLFDISEPNNIQFDQQTLLLDSLTLKQKIAQMIITYENIENKEILQKMLIGGIHFGAKEKKSDFIETINDFQEDATILFFTTADLEGCWNLFENFQEFPTLTEIENVQQAYQIGFQKGKLLKELGFSINFAPVLDLKDNIWNCRSFSGNSQEIAEKAKAYIKGIQDNGIIATSKHYPGKTLQGNDPHQGLNKAVIKEEDFLPFESTIKDNVNAVMISHIIVEGFLDSQSKPAVVSEKIGQDLRNKFTGLIISDEIRMRGLRDYYPDINQMYIDLFKAENDIILYFERDPKILYEMINIVEQAVKDGIINEKKIDDSVIRILKAKGIEVK